MIEIKKIDDSDFYVLQLLHRKMCHLIDETLSNSKCANSLILELNYKDAYALGLYKDKELVGFTLGYGITDSTYYFSSLYIEPAYRFYTLRLLTLAEQVIPPQYKVWESTSSTNQGQNILSKFGAKAHTIIYKKDL